MGGGATSEASLAGTTAGSLLVGAAAAAGEIGGAAADGISELLTWLRLRIFVPALSAAVVICLAMTVMTLLEKLFVGAVSLTVKIFRLKPALRYRWESMPAPDLESGGASSSYPMVLVQIPMYNEREVYKLSIGSACALDWPSEKMIVQVLDDSTDPAIKNMVEGECMRWKSKGVNIAYEVRDNRKGYKAGALKEGMKHDYVQDCDYVAMFDADFQPDPDFLLRTIPFLLHNPDIALVQARWKFVNADECLMTRIQEMSLDYHFKVEQEAGSSTFAFFGFNGTAGVWRIKAINEAGGWKDRTTVEDMDLAVRAGLQGWKFVYVGNIKVKSELPSTFKAYRYQQHRWSCGPANLFKKMAKEIITNEKVSLWKKFYLVYSFFFVGKVVAHTLTFTFYCIVIPVSVLIPEVEVPAWGMVYVPLIITLLKSVGTPSSLHLVIFWILFENAMSLHRFKAAMSGLLDAGGRVNEWVVTEKLGDAHMKMKPCANGNNVEAVAVTAAVNGEDERTTTVPLIRERPPRPRFSWLQNYCKRFYATELVVGFFIIFCGYYDLVTRRQGYFVFLFLQGFAFILTGVGFVGTFVPLNS